MKIVKILFLSVAVLLVAACQSDPLKDDPAKLAKRVELHYKIGLDSINKGNLPKAFDELLMANKLAPDNADVLAALGYAWRLRGELKKAERYYLRAIRHDPTPAIYTNFGSLLLDLGKPKKAEKMALRALENPRYPRPDIASIILGDALLAQ